MGIGLTSKFAVMSFLEVSAVTKNEGSTVAVKNISLTQQRLQNMAIAGETGSGKSTLLKIIAGIVTPDTGNVYFEGKRLKRIPDEKLIPGHPGIAYLSQHFDLPHNLTVEQVLIYANALPDDEAEHDENAKVLYELCDIKQLLTRRTDQLSGGERQRIALAMLLLSQPRLLLLDEPFSNLDMVHKSILKKVLHEVQQQLEVSIILVSHDPLDTLPWADEILIMQNGEIIQKGLPKDLYSKPVNAYAAGLLGKYNIIRPELAAYIPGMKNISQGKNIFLRPEDIYIVTQPEKNTYRAEVKNVYYYGSHYEIDIIVAGNYSLTIKAQISNVTKGSVVNIALPTAGNWFI